jgi:RNA polymerase sigma-70 factor (ECF subfamily)
MADDLEDRRLVKRLLAHDRQAFNSFFDGYCPRLYRVARTRLGHDPDTTKEIVHVTLSKAIRKLGSYRGEAAFFTWLCTICRNEISNHLERVTLAAPSSDEPEANFRRLETARLIQVALDQLPSTRLAREPRICDSRGLVAILRRDHESHQSAQRLLRRV